MMMLKGMTVILLGKLGIVRLYFYSIEEEYSNDLPIFTSIIESHEFQTGYEANAKDSVSLYNRDSPLTVITKMMFGALVVGAAAWVINHYRKKRKGSFSLI